MITVIHSVIFYEQPMVDNFCNFAFNPIQHGLFLKHYGMRGAIMAPLVTLVFLKVEGQNLVA